jgi:hypothetical protein
VRYFELEEVSNNSQAEGMVKGFAWVHISRGPIGAVGVVRTQLSSGFNAQSLLLGIPAGPLQLQRPPASASIVVSGAIV